MIHCIGKYLGLQEVSFQIKVKLIEGWSKQKWSKCLKFLKTMKGNYTGEDLLLYTAQLKTCCINRHVVPFCEVQAALEDMLSFQHNTHA